MTPYLVWVSLAIGMLAILTAGIVLRRVSGQRPWRKAANLGLAMIGGVLGVLGILTVHEAAQGATFIGPIYAAMAAIFATVAILINRQRSHEETEETDRFE